MRVLTPRAASCKAGIAISLSVCPACRWRSNRSALVQRDSVRRCSPNNKRRSPAVTETRKKLISKSWVKQQTVSNIRKCVDGGFRLKQTKNESRRNDKHLQPCIGSYQFWGPAVQFSNFRKHMSAGLTSTCHVKLREHARGCGITPISNFGKQSKHFNCLFGWAPVEWYV